MSWFNPSQEEANESYYNARSSYINAANQYNQNARQINSCWSDMSNVRNQYASYRSDKINFQKRIEAIGNIISSLEGNGGWLQANVPEAVNGANTSAQKAGTSFSQCVRCDSVPAPELSSVFKCESVSEDGNSAGALQSYKAEKTRLEQAVADVEKQMNNLNNQANELARRMNSINAQQQALRKSMSSSAFEMSHYKKYM